MRARGSGDTRESFMCCKLLATGFQYLQQRRSHRNPSYTNGTIPTITSRPNSQNAKRNDIRNEVAGAVIPAGAAYGGSRDQPSRWLYNCVNLPACNMKFQTKHLRDSHANERDLTSIPVHSLSCTRLAFNIAALSR